MTAWSEAATALLVGAALWWVLPPDFELRASLAALPLVFWLVSRSSRRLLTVSDATLLTQRRVGGLHNAIFGVLLATGLATLWLREGTLTSLWPPLAWLALLVLAISLAPHAGRSLARGADQPPSYAFFLGPLALYLLLLPWANEQRPPDGDEPWYLLLAHSLAYDFDADLGNNYEQGDSLRFLERRIGPQPGDPVGPAGEQFSRHSVTLAALLALPYRLGGTLAALGTMAALSAALAWASLFLLCAGSCSARAALMAWALLAAGSPLLLFSHQVWVEVPAALAAVAGLLLLRRLTATVQQSSALALSAFLAIVVFLPLLKLRFGVLSFGLVLAACFGMRHQLRQRAGLAAGLALAGVGSTVALLFYNQVTYGNALRIHSWQELLVFRTEPSFFLLRGSGIFFDLSFGLFATAPLWLLAIPGLVVALRQRRPLLWQGVLVFAPYLLLVASRREWYGGWSPPFRYGLVCLPWLAWLVALACEELEQRSARRLVAATLLCASIAVGLLWVAQPGWTYNFADGRALWLDSVERRIDLDLGRLLPSATRPRLSSWLAPPVLVALLLACWYWPGRRARSALGAHRLVLLASGTLMLLAAAYLAAARTLPTWRIEAEAAFVERTGGNVEPQRWQFDRTSLPEAWVLPDSASLRVPVRRGGETFRITVLARFIRNRDSDLRLDFTLGGQPMGSLVFAEPNRWSAVQSPPWRWPSALGPRAELVVSAAPPAGTGRAGVTNGLAIDRIELQWSDP